ncbi:TetR/AcrR family transcriptional regulator [Gordonia humi]|uniref:AcrR family transcriptional regulator n=3 Tax=Gordonia humi TaxID=686429 RepID=A0A840F2D4_9ACTN|nr:TetR/AcrR family transcriptional regulator [Gordonia humi]MBB4137982.1 AcrR family transcriptional regulator [Gordonia humi]MBB4138062.1 AcrR family transcriptional regulator [Gordonia humi]
MSLPASRSRPAASARGQRAEKAIVDAVLDLLDQDDASGLTVDKIANRAQVGKPTIYRRWSTKSELVAYAFGNLADPLPSGPQASLRDILITALTEFHARLTDTRHGRAWRKILGSQGEYADAMSIYRDKYLNPRRAALAAALQTHIDNGTIRNDVDAETLIRVISNTMLGGIITPDEPATTTSPELIVDLFLNGLLTGAAHNPPSPPPR